MIMLKEEEGATWGEDALPHPRIAAGPLPVDKELILRDLIAPPIYAWSTYGSDKHSPNHIEGDCSPDELKWLHYIDRKKKGIQPSNEVCV